MKGLTIINNFITEEEEKEILKNITVYPVTDTIDRNSIQRFGSRKPYNNYMVSTSIPDFLDKLSEKLVNAGVVDSKPNSISINEYLPGQGISKHIDNKKSGPAITIISLLGSCRMKFEKGEEVLEVDFPCRSLLQMKDEIRNEWTHAIEGVPEKRFSIVFRHAESL